MRNGKRQRRARANNQRVVYEDRDSIFFTSRKPLVHRDLDLTKSFIYFDTDNIGDSKSFFVTEVILPKVYEARRADGSTFRFCVSVPVPSKERTE